MCKGVNGRAFLGWPGAYTCKVGKMSNQVAYRVRNENRNNSKRRSNVPIVIKRAVKLQPSLNFLI